MRKIAIIAGREFWQRVRTRGFLLSAIMTPLILLVVLATGSFDDGGATTIEPSATSESEGEISTVAYVDEAGLIERTPPGAPQDMFLRFDDEASADAALEAGDVDAYYIVEPDYRETGAVRRVSAELPAGPPETNLFDWLLQANLAPELDATQLARLRNPFQSAGLQVARVTESETAGTGEGSGTNTIGFNMMPFLVAMLIMIPLFTSGSYLLASLTDEKSNRIMEILLVSIRPPALLAGKLLGLGALTMVQYVIWIVLGGGALLLLGQDFSAVTQAINLTSSELVLVLLYALGGYALYATLMAGLGALAPNMEAIRSWVFVITLPMLIPIYLWVVLVNSPASPVAIALSLFPFSAPIAMLMRMTSATVPVWQIVTSLLLVMLTAIFMVWLMSRLFRVQTLLSGEAFSPRRFLTVLRQG